MCSTQLAAESHGIYAISRKLKKGGPSGQGASLRPPWHDTQAELVWRRVLTLVWSLVPQGIVGNPNLWLLASGVSVQAMWSNPGPIRRPSVSRPKATLRMLTVRDRRLWHCRRVYVMVLWECGVLPN